MDAFFTRERANLGIKLPLTTPDGKATEHFIHIRGRDSDMFMQAEAEAKRSAFELITSEEDKSALPDKILAGKLELIAALVISWSFPQPCTKENIVKFLREAPQIADEIDTLASRRRLFFLKGSIPSTSTPASSSS